MQPIANFAGAGNTVQFLDFATNFCATTAELYQGASSTNDQADILLKSFIETTDQISLDLDKYSSALGTASEQARKQGDTQVTPIITDCQAIAKDLSQRLDKLKASGKPGKWKSFLVGVKQIWQEDELEELQNCLRKNRDELEWRIISSLRNNANLLASRQEDQFRDFQEAVVTKLTEMIQTQMTVLPQWPKFTEEIMQRLHTDMINIATSISQQPERSAVKKGDPAQNIQHDSAPQFLARKYATDWAEKMAQTEMHRWKSLSFQVMHDREDRIADAELKTFDWILEPPQNKRHTWNSFIEWLETGDSIYWISGKAGSGKSTMMKYLSTHCLVHEALARWGADTSVIIASYYFWYSGNALQKTQEGLLRSLLYQALMNHRELISTVLVGAFDVGLTELTNYWTLPRLKDAFKRLVDQKEVPLKICLLVDGLDEYAGDHAEIVAVFQNAAEHQHVKVCVSSRPLIIFDRAFKGHPGLVLQNLTFDDIKVYVKNRFRNDTRFQELESEEPGLGPELASQVVTKASGVFLWVKLVVHSLLEGIQNYDRGCDLERRLNELPEDLHDLYWHILDRVHPVWYLEQGFRLLLIVHSALDSLTLLRLAFAELESTIDQPLEFSIEKQNALCRGVAGRIKSRCLGLLEVVDNGHQQDHVPQQKVDRREAGFVLAAENTPMIKNNAHVQFLHKSVQDFIDTPAMKQRMQECLDKFEASCPETAILQAIYIELQTTWTRLSKSQVGDDGQLKREAWFDEVRPLNEQAERYAAVVRRKNTEVQDPVRTKPIVSDMKEINQITTELWNRVSFRSFKEVSGKVSWNEAPRVPGDTEHPEGNDYNYRKDVDLELSDKSSCFFFIYRVFRKVHRILPLQGKRQAMRTPDEANSLYLRSANSTDLRLDLQSISR